MVQWRPKWFPNENSSNLGKKVPPLKVTCLWRTWTNFLISMACCFRLLGTLGFQKGSSSPENQVQKQPDLRIPPKWSPKMPWKWKCLILSCGWELKGIYTGVTRAKAFHIKSKHPEEDPSLFRAEQHEAPVAATPHLPEEQRGWSCPLCQCHLPELPTHAKDRAIKLRCKTCHLGKTPKTLSLLIRIGAVNKSSGTVNGTHTIIKVDPVERRRADPNFRGYVYFCSACFSMLRGRTGCKAPCRAKTGNRKCKPTVLFCLAKERGGLFGRPTSLKRLIPFFSSLVWPWNMSIMCSRSIHRQKVPFGGMRVASSRGAKLDGWRESRAQKSSLFTGKSSLRHTRLSCEVFHSL